MATKKLSIEEQLSQAKAEIAHLKERYDDLHNRWTAEITARAKDSRELELAYARGIKLKGVVEYLEEKLKDE
jgi:SLT domain-containing protein